MAPYTTISLHFQGAWRPPAGQTTAKPANSPTLILTKADPYVCRLEWESAVLRGCNVFRQMEEERLDQLRQLGEKYNQAMDEHRPRLVASSQRLQEPVRKCDVRRDMEDVSKRVRSFTVAAILPSSVTIASNSG